MDANRLREQARHYRRLASSLWDRQMVQALMELAAEYDRQAEALEKLPPPQAPATDDACGRH
jgi:hypothetical protein